MYKDTVTVFNRYYSKQLNTATWYPHVLKNVDFNADKAANIEKTGLENADAAKLHVRYNAKDGTEKIGELQYLPPKQWEEQTNDMYEKTITFQEGIDFFMLGEFPESPISDNDPQYNTGTLSGFEDYMNRKYDDVYSITSVGKYSIIPHFEIGGA